MEPRKIVIRKYENRRLYDTVNSRYVNLEDVAAMIREGADVQVVDARTGEDLTRLILTQVIAEDAKGQESALPLDILRQLVIASGKVSQESMANYFKAVNDWYQSAYRAIATPGAPFDMMRAMFGTAAPEPWFYRGAQTAPPAGNPETPPEPASRPSEMDTLRTRIEELERQLSSKQRPAKARKPRKVSGKSRL